MYNEEYVKYLNSLHNVGAKNENAIAEASQNNKFFKDILIKRPTTDFIIKSLEENEPHIIIITGHAGDGKTSLLIQVLEELKAVEGNLKSFDCVMLPKGKECLYIKDFSEFSADDRKNKLGECLEMSLQGKYVILVANTGPLLNTFADTLGNEAQMELINAIDTNTGEIKNIENYKIRAINIASIDNSSFVKPFLKKLIAEKCFDKCNNCPKNDNCPILFNRDLIFDNQEKVFDFLHNHFIWQQEHGKRLTIRQIIAQITFALTSGLECKSVKTTTDKKYLFENLFSNSIFGYKGIRLNKQAIQVQAISDINVNGYDNKSLVSDEDIFVLQDYSSLHPRLQAIIGEIKNQYNNGSLIEWQKSVRRMYILFNIETDSDINEENLKCIFSKKFPRYLDLRNGKIPNNDDKILIMEAFSILFVGHANKNSRKISITMKRENSVEQSVQMLYGIIDTRDMKLKTLNSSSCNFGEDGKKELYIEVFDKKINYPISISLLNYFEDIRSGIISTNIDPQLTHGIDSIKAQILSLPSLGAQSGNIEMIVMGTKEWATINLQEENNNWILI